MADSSSASNLKRPAGWLRSLGPAIIIACVVLGPGSLLVNANVGAEYGYQLLWLLGLTGVLMCTYVVMAMRIGVVGGATPCTLLANHLGRPVAAVIGINLFLICSTFQFGNNLAVAAAVKSLIPGAGAYWVLLAINGLIIVFLFAARQIYRVLERVMKIMVGVILVCFVINLVIARPRLGEIIEGFAPSMPKIIGGSAHYMMLLIASLLGTTFSIGAAFYQGNLVREKGWTVNECSRGLGDAIVGVSVLTIISLVIMITTATVIPGQRATDIGTLAQSMRPLLGATAHVIFCVGLMAVSMNPFLINAMIGGSILADGIGKKPKLSDRWPRRFTVLVLIVGMGVAMLALRTDQQPVKLVIFGQALTVLGNPLMAVALLWLANQKSIMGERRNKLLLNVLGGVGLVVVILMAVLVLYLLVLRLS